MDAQEIKNIAGVAYIQTRLRQFWESPFVVEYELVEIDGMFGPVTGMALRTLVQNYLDPKSLPAPQFSTNFGDYRNDIEILQAWYKYLYHIYGITSPKWTPPQTDGKWGTETKRCFDDFFAHVSRNIPTDDNRKPIADQQSAGVEIESVTTTNPKWKNEINTLISKTMSMDPFLSKGVTIEVLAATSIILVATERTTSKPVGMLIAQVQPYTNDVTKFAHQQMCIKGAHVSEDFWDKSVCHKLVDHIMMISWTGALERVAAYKGTEGSPTRDLSDFLLTTPHFRSAYIIENQYPIYVQPIK